MITWKISLVIVILNIKLNQIINKIYNFRLSNIKILTIIKV